MSEEKETFDVFLSYAHADRPIAQRVWRSLTQAGLNVFDPAQIAVGASFSDEIWRALALSDAIVAVIPAEGNPNPNTAAELGAGMAWSKPIFLLCEQNGPTRAPSFLREYPLYPVSRVDDVVAAIKRRPVTLPPDEMSALEEIYVELGTPMDRLIRDPALLDQLARRFRDRTKVQLPSERLLNTMLIRRKQGRWPKLKNPRGQRHV